MSATGKNKIKITVRSASKLGQAFSRFRKKADLTQGEIAAKTGLRQAGISQIESGSNGTRLSTLFKILAVLDLELVVRRRRKSNTKIIDSKNIIK